MWLWSLRHLSLFRHTRLCGGMKETGFCITKPRRAHPAYDDVKEMKQKLRSQLPLTFGGERSFTTRRPDQRHKPFKETSSQPYLPSCFPNRPVHVEHKSLRTDSSAHVVWTGKKKGGMGAKIKWWQRAQMRWEATHTHTHIHMHQ